MSPLSYRRGLTLRSSGASSSLSSWSASMSTSFFRERSTAVSKLDVSSSSLDVATPAGYRLGGSNIALKKQKTKTIRIFSKVQLESLSVRFNKILLFSKVVKMQKLVSSFSHFFQNAKYFFKTSLFRKNVQDFLSRRKFLKLFLFETKNLLIRQICAAFN